MKGSAAAHRLPAGAPNRPLPGALNQEVHDLEERMLLERLDPQAGIDECGDDLAKAVIPAVLLLLADVTLRSA